MSGAPAPRFERLQAVGQAQMAIVHRGWPRSRTVCGGPRCGMKELRSEAQKARVLLRAKHASAASDAARALQPWWTEVVTPSMPKNQPRWTVEASQED